jgi:hypothetical protein
VVTSAPKTTSGIRVHDATPNCSDSSRSVASMSSVTHATCVIGPLAMLTSGD